ncbi:MAG: biliverdin-producing heme oxygenase [Acidobacteriota bacterium]|nr:biliverdin-producing heme oxygenase [Acidobacteriota bacterium]
MTGGLADRLKAGTADQHAAAENHVFQQDLVRGEVSRTALVAHQSAMLDLVRLIHARLLAQGPDWQDFAQAMGGHAGRLARDLEELGGESQERPSRAVMEFAGALGGARWTPEATLAAFYVIEGSMNGNRFIRRALVENRPELAGCLRYFDPYGQGQRARWKEFRSAIDRIGATLSDPEAAVRAARETFALAGTLASEAQAAEAVAA